MLMSARGLSASANYSGGPIGWCATSPSSLLVFHDQHFGNFGNFGNCGK